MKKSEAIKLLTKEKWTKADAERALVKINFSTNPDELTIRRAISSFAGSELINRQRLQAAQKRLVTTRNKELEELKKGNKKLLSSDSNILEAKIKTLTAKNKDLIKVNQELQKDNKNLKNIVDRIKLQLAIDTKKLLRYEDSELRKEIIKLFKWTLG
ncbi:MAG: hypothetical protein QNJ41_27195 [Xenococcaceae cyanobacterium MO_188.B32]|nr:hypothetical protein [Xenococcaceae cyanobacterium MO_188.B32]